jgi:membrane protease YdiL (CAAX protease family)
MNNTFSIRAAIGIVLVSILSAFIAGGLVLGIGLSNPDSPQKFYTFISFIIGQGFMLVPLIWFLISKQEPVLKRLRLNPISSSTAGFTILFSLGLIILSDELDRIIQIFIPAPEYIIDLNGLLRPETITGFILLFIAVAIIAPLGEELLFRGFLQQVLEKHWKDVTKAILVTSLFFALIHMNPYWFAQIYILGVMLGFLSWKTGSVLPSLILHGLNNTMAMIFAFSEAGEGNIYIWNGHVAPWIIIIALACTVIGFKVINGLRMQA